MNASIDERLVHRLEAFSDIVIAFALSEVAFSLQVSQRQELLTHPIHLVGFLAGFAFVASIWWAHNRIFSRYFIPDTMGIFVNFMLLAATMVFAWAQQLFYRFGLGETTALLYAAAGGTVYVLIGFLFLRGTRDLRLELSDADRRYGVWRGVRALAIGAVLLCSLICAPLGFERVAYAWLLTVPVMAILRVLQLRQARTDNA